MISQKQYINYPEKMAHQKMIEDSLAECRAMTQIMKDTIAEAEVKQEAYTKQVAEYSRRKRNYDSTTQLFMSECGGNLEPGDVFFRGAHPACRNRKLNVPPVQPAPPVLPDLGVFVCQICSQDVSISGDAGRDFNVAKGAIQQQMNCVASVEQQLRDDLAAEERAAKELEADQQHAAEEAAAAATERSKTQTIELKKTSAQPTQKSNSTLIIIIIIICILVAIAVGVALYFFYQHSPDVSLT